MKQQIRLLVDIEDVLAADFVAKPYHRPVKKGRKATLKIAWVLSPVSPGSGGINTIARFVRFLSSQQHDITIYIYEAVRPQSESTARRILSHSFGVDVTVKKIANYEESDIVIATGWETAYPVFNIKTHAHKFYFVQDYEPSFYSAGSQALLAENTYRMGFYGITAGKWLADRLSSEYGMICDHFDFGVEPEIYSVSAGEASTKHKKISFYARPSTPRRAFELGVIALDIFHRKHPEYTIEFFGSDVSNYDIQFPYVNRGILSHEDLAILYRDSVACLVLSLTNASLLPHELLAAGCIPIVNESGSNRASTDENRYVHYADARPVQLAEAIGAAVERPDIDKHASMAARSVRGASWQVAYEKVQAILFHETMTK